MEILEEHQLLECQAPSQQLMGMERYFRVRDKMKKFVTHYIGNGKSTNLWFDPWLPKGSPVDQFGHNIIMELGRGQHITVDNFIEDGKWSLWPETSPDLLQAWRQIEEQTFVEEKEDIIVWMPSVSGRFTIKSAWDALRQPNQKWPFSNIV